MYNYINIVKKSDVTIWLICVMIWRTYESCNIILCHYIKFAPLYKPCLYNVIILLCCAYVLIGDVLLFNFSKIPTLLSTYFAKTVAQYILSRDDTTYVLTPEAVPPDSGEERDEEAAATAEEPVTRKRYNILFYLLYYVGCCCYRISIFFPS